MRYEGVFVAGASVTLMPSMAYSLVSTTATACSIARRGVGL
jgi:hypothetical protein